jgi:Protein of unknown function (DUF2971)
MYTFAKLLTSNELDKFYESIATMSYRERRQRLWRATNPRQSRFLYKYHSFDGPYSIVNLRSTIVDGVLRLSRAADFNDPFDMTAHVVVDGTPSERWERFESIVRRNEPHLGWRAQKAKIEELTKRPDAELIRFCKAAYANIKTTAGVYCFAGSGKSTLMWSHYAANHTGVCLQFERAKDFATLCQAVRVKYALDLPTVNWMTPGHQEVQRMLLAKHPDWAYEKESRIIAPEQAGLYLQFKPAALRGIIYGCKTTDMNIGQIQGLLRERKALGHPNITEYRATQHPSQYKLVVHRR